ncbi:hypothetical protein HHI36_000308 [Cryptolaemus montrouzieri]|uniref:Uncharacterized protein n=1 Tax=Cryptolaemus montrouzieri TaxID=559131 RepID=A0ABD2P492_9CUCU
MFREGRLATCLILGKMLEEKDWFGKKIGYRCFCSCSLSSHFFTCNCLQESMSTSARGGDRMYNQTLRESSSRAFRIYRSKARSLRKFSPIRMWILLQECREKDSPSPFSSTETLFKNEMKSLVVDPIRHKDEDAHILIKQFYHECMNLTKIDEDKNAAFMDAIDELGGWPLINGSSWDASSFDWVDWYIKAKKLGLPVIGFFDFKVAESSHNETVLRVTGPHMDSGFLSQKVSLLARWHKHVHKVFEKLYLHRDDLEDVVVDDDGDTTVQNLTEICPDIPWLKILNGISPNSSQFNNNTEVVYYMDDLGKYCETVDKILKDNHPKVIANYFVWTILRNSYKYLHKHIRWAFEDVMAEGDDERFTICYEAVDERFKWVKETIYVRKKTTPQVKEQIQEMIDIMKDIYMERLKDCDWMDEDTRKLAVEKAKEIESMVGADDELYDPDFDKYLGVDGFKFTSDNMFKMLQQKFIKENNHLFESLYGPIPDDWGTFFEEAVEVNAFFLPSANAMIIPAPILTSIFFNRKFPAFMNYGPMESTIGHEFMHGFSETARKYTLKNDTVIDWWTPATTAMYKKKVQCVIDEYERIPSDIRKLDDNAVDYEEEDVHAIPIFRIQAPARNSIHFAEAFNCPEGSFMNPKDKCRIL